MKCLIYFKIYKYKYLHPFNLDYRSRDYIDPVVVMASSSNNSRSSPLDLKGVGRSALRKTDTKGSTHDTEFSNGANYGLSFSIIGMYVGLLVECLLPREFSTISKRIFFCFKYFPK